MRSASSPPAASCCSVAVSTSVPRARPWPGQARPVHVPVGSSTSQCSRTCASRSWTRVIRSTPLSPVLGMPVAAIAIISSLPACRPPLSFCGLQVGITVCSALEDKRGGRDFWFGRLKDGIFSGASPDRERLAEVTVIGVRGGDHQALSVGELTSEIVVLGGKILDPLTSAGRRVAGSHGEFGPLRRSSELGLGGAKRLIALLGVPAPQLGIGGDSQLPLMAGSTVPILTVSHDGGEYRLALSVSLVHGSVADGLGVLASGLFMVALEVRGCGVGT